MQQGKTLTLKRYGFPGNLAILIYNHFLRRMNTKRELNDKLLLQDFVGNDRLSESMDRFKLIAEGYSRIENAIAVLSDLKKRTSYIYYGGITETLGLCSKGECHSVNSIWEEEIFRCISTTDLEKRHLDELKFIHFLRNKPQKQRSDYYLVSILSMTGKDGRKHHVRHRVFYVAIQPNGSIRLALCLYNLTDDKTNTESYICESVSGKVFSLEQQDYNDLISTREKEILRLIDRGMQSKEISENLSISIHTVNRHRQNILSKLCATNSIEACRVAKQLKLI